MSAEWQEDLFGAFAPAAGVHQQPPADARHLPGSIVLQRSQRARNYRLTLRRDGIAVATIPPRGSEREAWRFIERHRDWLERARQRQQRRPAAAPVWTVGTH